MIGRGGGAGAAFMVVPFGTAIGLDVDVNEHPVANTIKHVSAHKCHRDTLGLHVRVLDAATLHTWQKGSGLDVRTTTGVGGARELLDTR